ncbi:GNAT family N-acetyltransferase [Sneathiella marina]|uniref:GNAT family N-acetyltransferase n=1 Tax=Sneathiella marina TaxID=2950108 RepID=A0ABY4W1R8_9PROT|nr:GNAT family N-acetyltransferase [Sneathiella marina]USG61115.1 GNAT family N-acetyltransferase [Sneathiella marina]
MSPPSDITLRPFEKRDLARLTRLIHHVIDTSYAEVYPPRAVEFFKSFHSQQKILDRCSSGTVLVMEENGTLVGTGSTVDDTIFAVFVDPGLQKGGRGKMLMTALENAAIDAGVTQSRLDISLPSRRFYEGLGYVVTEEMSRDLGDGQRLDFWKAVKKLSPL